MRWLGVIFITCGTVWLGYGVGQSDFTEIILGFSMAFGGYVLFNSLNQTSLAIRDMIVLGLFLRIILFPSFPHLSDDIYRFVWDGQMMHNGYNPYSHTPRDIQGTIVLPELYDKLNSQTYYSVYPAVNQAIFWLATCFDASLTRSVLVIRLFLMVFDVLLLIILLRWFKKMNLPESRAAWIFLNPLLIVETYNNLHFEIIMIALIVITIYFLRRIILSSILLALAIATKLIPLIFLPLIAFNNSIKHRAVRFGLITISTLVLMMPILLSSHHTGFFESINLYFQTFEFNASLYYILRWMGYQWKGYNMIQWIGPILSLVTLVIVLYLSWTARTKEKATWPMFIALILTTYYLMSTTVHPWYIINILVFGVIAGLRYPIIWSFVCIMSYSAYAQNPVEESLLWSSIEYATLLIAFASEWPAIKNLLSGE